MPDRTPAELLTLADVLETRALDALRSGEHDRATVLAAEAVLLRDEAGRGLPPQTKSGKKSGMDSIALRMAQGRRSKSRLSEAALAANLTLRELAARVGVSHAQLSSAHAGRFTIKEEVAKRVEELTGFAATRKNWPKGWAR